MNCLASVIVNLLAEQAIFASGKDLELVACDCSRSASGLWQGCDFCKGDFVETATRFYENKGNG